jgi:hypothetical protein
MRPLIILAALALAAAAHAADAPKPAEPTVTELQAKIADQEETIARLVDQRNAAMTQRNNCVEQPMNMQVDDYVKAQAATRHPQPK